jgi:hypothetical protein
MKKRILFLIVSSLALVLYAQENEAAAPAAGIGSGSLLGGLAAALDADIEATLIADKAADAADKAAAAAEERAAAEEKAAAEEAAKRNRENAGVNAAMAEAGDQADEDPEYSAVVSYFKNPGTTTHTTPFRIVELGGDITLGLGTSLINVGDIFHKNLVINLDDRYEKTPKRGIDIGANVAVHPFYLNIYIPETGWIFGLFTNADIRLDANVPKDLLGLISQGNSEKHPDKSGEIAVSGAIFAETGLSWSGSFLKNKLRIGVAPAYYTPLVYISKSTLKYNLKTAEELSVAFSGGLNLYHVFDTPLKLGGGADLSVSGEYALFPIIDVGAAISHIPIVPANLTNGNKFNITGDGENGTIIHTDNHFDGIGDIGGIDLKEGKKLPDKLITRPLRFDFYTLYRPFRQDLLTIRPSIGFTVLNPSEEAYFNGVLEAQLHLGKVDKLHNDVAVKGYLLNLSLSTGIEEGYWRHMLGIALNLRAVELDLEVGLKSQDYLMSYQASGLELTLGIKYGW